jgi:hypothetical protein
MITCKKLKVKIMKQKVFFQSAPKCMSRIMICCIAIASILYASCSDLYDNIKDFAGEEIVYPAHFDTIYARPGYERIELYLSSLGKVPSSQMNLGKAKRTVVEYDDKTLEFDSVCSWVAIKDLTQPRLYRFKVYTEDEHKNRSTPKEIALSPYTSLEKETLVVPYPNSIATSASSAVIEWSNGLTSKGMEYRGLIYSYVDKDNETRTGTKWNSAQFFINNLEPGKEVTVNMRYWVIPRIEGANILDSVYIDQPLKILMPDASAAFYPAERDILEANGVREFNAAGTAGVTKLVYPIHTESLLDIFYFPDLKELDLTGTNMPLTSLTYNRNSVTSTVGGGAWTPCISKTDNLQDGVEILLTLLESGVLEKVRYAPNSMGLDDILAPYIESGVVELVDTPDEVLMPNQFNLNGTVQDNSFTVDITYPATDAPNSAELSEIYKVVVKQRSASFVFALPSEYRYNAAEYPYLKLKIYAPAKSAFPSGYTAYQRLWFRLMNYMWAFTSYGYPGVGQQVWNTSTGAYEIPNEYLQKWYDLTLDISRLKDTHNRVIIINIGEEANPSPWNPPLIEYYFANIRFSKNP